MDEVHSASWASNWLDLMVLSGLNWDCVRVPMDSSTGEVFGDVEGLVGRYQTSWWVGGLYD